MPYKNPQERISYQQEYRTKNADRIKRQRHENYIKNKGAIDARKADYNKRHPEVKKESAARYRAKHKAELFFKKWGITLQQYEEKAQAQAWVCAICKLPPNDGRWNKLHIDHNHETGQIRGLLCHRCNTAIGSLREDAKILQAAAAYLLQWSS